MYILFYLLNNPYKIEFKQPSDIWENVKNIWQPKMSGLGWKAKGQLYEWLISFN